MEKQHLWLHGVLYELTPVKDILASEGRCKTPIKLKKERIEEKDGKIFIDGVEYIPKETEKLPKTYSDIIGKHDYTKGYIISGLGDLCETTIGFYTKGVFFNRTFAEAMLKLKNLLEIRNEYNGNWKPDVIGNLPLYCIEIWESKIHIDIHYGVVTSEFIFKSKELAEQFLENHREDIEFVFKHLYMWNN